MAKNDLQEDVILDPSETPEEPIAPDYGVLGYVTIGEANDYIAEHYMLSENVRVRWESLEDSDKAVLLRRSFQAIELLPFAGRKTCCMQDKAFPRWPCNKVPDAIKHAQMEQAFVDLDEESSEDAKHYAKLWQWGVSSYTIGNLSESLSTGTYGAGALRTAGISSPKAASLLAPFIQGGFRIT